MRTTVEPIYAIIGANIRRIRREQKISQEKIAEILGLAKSVSISEYERGIQRIHVHTLYQVADFLGVAIYDLLEPLQPYVQCEECKQSRPMDACIVVRKELDDDMFERRTYRCKVCDAMFWQIWQRLQGQEQEVAP